LIDEKDAEVRSWVRVTAQRYKKCKEERPVAIRSPSSAWMQLKGKFEACVDM
jgi:hypothetical protein